MALKVKPPVNTATSVVPAQPVQPSDTVLLELALYSNYTWKKQAFEKGKAYRFNKTDAVQLLSETDHGRPIWRVFKPVKPKVQAQAEVVDATEIEVVDPNPPEPIHGLTAEDEEKKRIEIGDDSEIADILGKVDGGDVTV